jgi:hypothetical protein
MADKKISALDAATTPLTGTEVVAIVQSNTTKKVPVADLTTGRALSATQLTLTTGNLIVASGKGIDFSDTPGTGTSELLADYEEGLHTASITCGTSGTVTMNTGRDAMAYTRIGRQVTVTGMIEVLSVLLPVGYFTISLPYAIATLSEFSARTTGTVIFPPITGSTKDFVVLTVEGESFIRIYKGSGSSYTSDAAEQLQATTQIHVSFTYFV